MSIIASNLAMGCGGCLDKSFSSRVFPKLFFNGYSGLLFTSQPGWEYSLLEAAGGKRGVRRGGRGGRGVVRGSR